LRADLNADVVVAVAGQGRAHWQLSTTSSRASLVHVVDHGVDRVVPRVSPRVAV
jgi:hypothetical protein